MSQGQLPTSKIAARLKNVVSYPKDDPTAALKDVLGWDQHQNNNVHVVVDESTDYSFGGTVYPRGRRLLADTSLESTFQDPFSESRRTLGDKIVLANNDVYDNLYGSGSDWRIKRMYYVPRYFYPSGVANADEKNAFINNEDFTVYPYPSSFAPGGVLYERRLNSTAGNAFSFTAANGVTWDDTDIFFDAVTGPDSILTWDENPQGMDGSPPTHGIKRSNFAAVYCPS